jgi:exonuclease SbcC
MFDQDYNVFVQDRGVQRPITELSGGEIDLVALAVRLGLASVVSERHGSGGAGFLILDECFGSQDPSRRMSILNALRGLKQTHGQIFLISHVGGLEDAADAVIEVEIDDDANAVAVRT